jgi:protein phosphatase
MPLCLDAACDCNIGKIRTNNEDNFYFNGETLEMENPGLVSPLHRHFDRNTVCFGVFDGMGGAEDGQIASFIAARSFQKDCQSIENIEMLSESFFCRTVEHMNDLVCLEAETKKSNMGCTAVMLGFCMDALYVCHVGDSRVYRHRDNRMVQITLDHVEALPPFMQKSRNRKPHLSQCIGISPDELKLDPYIMQGIAKPGDIYLLCSDGLTDMVDDSLIEEILSAGENAYVCVKRLVRTALENGGRDNTTVIVVKVLDISEDNNEN